MSQLASLWSGWNTRQRLTLIVGSLAVALVFFLMFSIVSRPSLSLLYAQIDDAAAGEVVRALEQRNVPYEVRDGSIFVPSSRRDELRLTFASEGLPANGTKGYELLDSLSGFGTTSQMFDAAYWRAKEGEIARTMMSSPEISAARVHIAREGANPFRQDGEATASVFVTSAAGTISPELARSLRFLVASAVPRMSPEEVTIIDSSGRMLALDPAQQGLAQGNDLSTELRDRVQRLLEARVGLGNAVVEVSVETVNETESILERTVDPESRVAVSVDTEERVRDDVDGGRALSVASNLPDGDAAGGEGSRSQNNETRERINYEISEITREVIRNPGAIRRLTVAVLVNGESRIDDQGVPIVEPRSDEELEDLRLLVSAALGLDEERGDEITIRSMEFAEVPESGTAGVATPWYGSMFDIMDLSRIALLGLVALAVGMFVVRPLLTAQSAQTETMALPGPVDGEVEGAPAMMEAGEYPTMAIGNEGGGEGFGDGGFMAQGMGDFAAIEEDPVERLRGLIDSRKDETVEVIRTWLEDGEKA